MIWGVNSETYQYLGNGETRGIINRYSEGVVSYVRRKVEECPARCLRKVFHNRDQLGQIPPIAWLFWDNMDTGLGRVLKWTDLFQCSGLTKV